MSSDERGTRSADGDDRRTGGGVGRYGNRNGARPSGDARPARAPRVAGQRGRAGAGGGDARATSGRSGFAGSGTERTGEPGSRDERSGFNRDRGERTGGHQGGARSNRPSGSGYQGDRSARPGGDRGGYQGDRSSGGFNRDRGERTGGYQGDRSSRATGDRGPRTGGYQGDRGNRPGGGFNRDGGERTGGDQGGERPSRPAGGGYQGDRRERPTGDRGPRTGGYQGDRGERTGGYQGDRPSRPSSSGYQGDRSERPAGGFTRDRGERTGGYQGGERPSRPSGSGFQGDRARGAAGDARGGYRSDRRDGGDRGATRRPSEGPGERPRGAYQDRPRRDDDRGARGSSAGRPPASRGPRRDDADDRRASRPPQPVRVYGPAIPDDVEFGMLDRDVRGRLRTLSKDNAGIVGRHLVMTGRLLDEDPELAYEHAQAAVRHGGRVDVVREAAGLAAYRTGRFAEALRELRTVRRLNGSSEHLAVMADCERGLGRPERALTLAASPEAETLDAEARVELAMVVSGARLDMGDPDAAIAALAGFATGKVRTLLDARVAQARADALRAAGRTDEADATEAAVPAALLAQVSDGGEDEEDVVVFDLADEADAETGDAEAEADPEDADAEETDGDPVDAGTGTDDALDGAQDTEDE